VRSVDLLVASLCDFSADYGGKLMVVGAFDTLVTRDLPAVHPQCAIALRFIFRKEDEGLLDLKITFVDEDGHPILPPLETTAEIEVPDEVFFLTRNFVLNMQHLRFDAAGLYAVDIAANGRHIASIPLQIRLAAYPGEPGRVRPQG
jgi:hypothetical protein